MEVAGTEVDASEVEGMEVAAGAQALTRTASRANKVATEIAVDRRRMPRRRRAWVENKRRVNMVDSSPGCSRATVPIGAAAPDFGPDSVAVTAAPDAERGSVRRQSTNGALVEPVLPGGGDRSEAGVVAVLRPVDAVIQEKVPISSAAI